MVFNCFVLEDGLWVFGGCRWVPCGDASGTRLLIHSPDHAFARIGKRLYTVPRAVLTSSGGACATHNAFAKILL